jgi:hypothetical protein
MSVHVKTTEEYRIPKRGLNFGPQRKTGVGRLARPKAILMAMKFVISTTA